MRTRSLPLAAAVLLSQTSTAQQVTIIESQSYSEGHAMDTLWAHTANLLGYPYTIEQQGFLDDPANLATTDVLIVSSAMVDFTGTNHLQTIVQYVLGGGATYIQSEYDTVIQGNITYDSVMTALGVPFLWTDILIENQAPVFAAGLLATTPYTIDSINYFWFACTGVGSGVEPFLLAGNAQVGWVYPPLTKTSCTQLITSSDQDWIRHEAAPELLANILVALAGCLTTAVPEPDIATTQVWMDGNTGEIHATCTAPGSNEFILRDASGREVMRRRFTGTAIISTPAVRAGVYIYELHMSSGESATGRLARW